MNLSIEMQILNFFQNGSSQEVFVFGISDYGYITVQADHSEQGTYKETVAGAMYGFENWSGS